MASEEDFEKEPSVDLLSKFSKRQLLNLAATHEVELTTADKRNKASIMAVVQAALVSKGILTLAKPYGFRLG